MSTLNQLVPSLTAEAANAPFVRVQIKVISDLRERERMVLTLPDHEELTMNEIGIILDVVESRVPQIHAPVVSHVRAGHAALGTIGTYYKWKLS
jgi:DNA-directed RNA polymerase specialized sigma subunit